MREKGQQLAKILTHLVTYQGEKREKCQLLLYVGRCKGKTDIFQFFSSSFFYEPFSYLDPGIGGAGKLTIWYCTRNPALCLHQLECGRGGGGGCSSSLNSLDSFYAMLQNWEHPVSALLQSKPENGSLKVQRYPQMQFDKHLVIVNSIMYHFKYWSSLTEN